MILVAGFLVFSNQKNAPKNGLGRVCVKDSCYDVEIAKTPQEQARGLMFRESLADGKGMLFVFESEIRHSFWMKNTLISLDIIWIDSDGKIVYISQNTPPCVADPCPSYAPDAPAKYVLEVAAGQIQKTGAQAGDIAAMEF